MKKLMSILETMQAESERMRKAIDEKYGTSLCVPEGYTEAMDYYKGFRDAVNMMEDLVKMTYLKFYFTFGTDPKFPYGIEDYVVVYGTDLGDAIHKFQKKYPNPSRSSAINCTFWYDEDQWKGCCEPYYENKLPSDVIM